MCKTVILIFVAAFALSSAQDGNTTTASTSTGSTVSPSPTTAPGPQTCSSEGVASIDWNNTALVGTWKEVTRTPIGNTNACLVFTTALNNLTLSISAIQSSSNTSTYQNVYEQANVTLVPNATTGYSVTFKDGSTNKTPVFIKLLQFVQNNYIVGCGYTNASNVNTSYGFILGRAGSYSTDYIVTVNNDAAASYSNFQTNNYSSILQDGCTTNSAAQSLPLITGVLALALLLIKAY